MSTVADVPTGTESFLSVLSLLFLNYNIPHKLRNQWRYLSVNLPLLETVLPDNLTEYRYTCPVFLAVDNTYLAPHT